jgi:hypothetical protein
MDGRVRGRVTAVALLALLIPMSAAALGMSTPVAYRRLGRRARAQEKAAQEKPKLEDYRTGQLHHATKPIKPGLAPATPTTQGASIPAVSPSGAGCGNGVDLAWWSSIGLTVGLRLKR